MPPRAIIDREDILDATIALVRKEGSASINARSIAKALNCSTKPIFRVYENMEELKKDVYQKAEDYFGTCLYAISADDNNLLEIGKNYIKFANEEKELYKFLFLSESLEIKHLDELINRQMVDYIMKSAKLNERQSKELFIEIWLLIHGISTLLATNPCTLDDKEIEHLLINAYTAKYEYSVNSSGG